MIELEEQRIGRNKETIVNHAYINSGEYKRKYDFISNNKELSRILYKLVVEGYLKNGYNEDEAQIMALSEIQENFDINFKEVTDNGSI